MTIDLAFNLRGETLPAGYPFLLWDALLERLPALADIDDLAVLPLRTAPGRGECILTGRSKLVLRIPEAALAAVSALSGQQLEIDGRPLALGAASSRALQAYPTLHAHLVDSREEEVAFMAWVQMALAAMGIAAPLICGRHQHLSNDTRAVQGYSLVIHDLKPEESLRLQGAGLGANRFLGCGVFMPYKVISGLE